MNDAVYLILGLSPVLIIAAWWIYSLSKMRRNVDTLTERRKRDKWNFYRTKKNPYTVSISKEHFAYRAYNTTMDFLSDHIIFDIRADSERTD